MGFFFSAVNMRQPIEPHEINLEGVQMAFFHNILPRFGRSIYTIHQSIVWYCYAVEGVFSPSRQQRFRKLRIARKNTYLHVVCGQQPRYQSSCYLAHAHWLCYFLCVWIAEQLGTLPWQTRTLARWSFSMTSRIAVTARLSTSTGGPVRMWMKTPWSPAENR